jgi:hypothetical protein
MANGGFIGGRASKKLDKDLRFINTLYAFIIIVLFVLIIGYAYGPLSDALAYLPSYSVTIILLLTAGLTLAGVFLSSKHCREIISNLDRYHKKLDGIFAITEKLRGDTNVDNVLQVLLRFAIKLTRSNAGYVLLYGNDGLVLSSAVGGGFDKHVGMPVENMYTLAEHVISTGKPTLLGTMRPVEKTAPAEGKAAEGAEAPPPPPEPKPLITAFHGRVRYQAQNGICIPLRTKRGAIGAMELLNTRTGRFDPLDVRLLCFIADQAADSVELASLAHETV